MPKSCYWSVSVCYANDAKCTILDRIHRSISYRYCLIVTLQENENHTFADVFMKFLIPQNKTQVMKLLSPIGLNYSKQSLKAISKKDLDVAKSRNYISRPVEFGFEHEEEQSELMQNGPINTDLQLFESEQEKDPDDPEDQPKISIRKIACMYRRMDCPIRTSYPKRIIDDDGDYADPEYHRSKQQRLEELARENPDEPIFIFETNKYFL